VSDLVLIARRDPSLSARLDAACIFVIILFSLKNPLSLYWF
jgi:hypothetical protein